MGVMIRVRPIEGGLVRMPGTMTPLPKEGAMVPYDASPEGIFWRRRLRDGSVTMVEEQAGDAQPAADDKEGGN